jgi:hypothetical protein
MLYYFSSFDKCFDFIKDKFNLGDSELYLYNVFKSILLLLFGDFLFDKLNAILLSFICSGSGDILSFILLNLR